MRFHELLGTIDVLNQIFLCCGEGAIVVVVTGFWQPAGFYPLEASNIRPVRTTKNVFKHCQVFPVGHRRD